MDSMLSAKLQLFGSAEPKKGGQLFGNFGVFKNGGGANLKNREAKNPPHPHNPRKH